MTLPTPKQVAHEYWHRLKTETVLLEDAILADRKRVREACAIEAAIHSNYPIECEYDQGYSEGRKEAAAAIRALDLAGKENAAPDKQ